MKKKEIKNVDDYSKYPLCKRLLFFFTGFLNPLVGFSLFYMFKDKEEYEWQTEFLQRGSMFGVVFIGFGIIINIVEFIIKAI